MVTQRIPAAASLLSLMVVGNPDITILADPDNHFTAFWSEPVTIEAGETAHLLVEGAVTQSQLIAT